MALLLARSGRSFVAAARVRRTTIAGPLASAVLPPFIAALSVPASPSPPAFLPRARLFSAASSSASSAAAAPAAHGLSHVDAALRPTMVDVGGKVVTARSATAQCLVLLPDDVASRFDPLRADWSTAKGPVLTTAIIAGTQAVKRTAELIPFCHPLPLDSCKFHTEWLADHAHPRGRSALRVECTVKCHARTGIEMEALTGVTVAALTVYDMLKALSHHIVITDIKLMLKSGGKSDFVDTRTEGTSKSA